MLARRSFLIVLPAVMVCLAKAQAAPLPDFEIIERAVAKHFEDLPDYRDGDLLARAPTKELLEKLEKLGWKEPNAAAILERIPADDDFIAKSLSTSRGKSFMRQIAKYPNAYDRLDRLSRLPRGKDMVRSLIVGPDGYKLLEYMTSTSGGKELGKMLSEAPRGTNFNRSTGKIYTATMLLAELRLDYGETVNPQASAR